LPSRFCRTQADESTLERIAALRLNQPRKPAQVATGSVSFTATAGAVLDVDTLLQSSDGRTYKVTAARVPPAMVATAPRLLRWMPVVWAMPTPVWR
jgi:uncharacterized phage protein gp47/JayE